MKSHPDSQLFFDSMSHIFSKSDMNDQGANFQDHNPKSQDQDCQGMVSRQLETKTNTQRRQLRQWICHSWLSF